MEVASCIARHLRLTLTTVKINLLLSDTVNLLNNHPTLMKKPLEVVPSIVRNTIPTLFNLLCFLCLLVYIRLYCVCPIISVGYHCKMSKISWIEWRLSRFWLRKSTMYWGTGVCVVNSVLLEQSILLCFVVDRTHLVVVLVPLNLAFDHLDRLQTGFSSLLVVHLQSLMESHVEGRTLWILDHWNIRNDLINYTRLLITMQSSFGIGVQFHNWPVKLSITVLQ